MEGGVALENKDPWAVGWILSQNVKGLMGTRYIYGNLNSASSDYRAPLSLSAYVIMMPGMACHSLSFPPQRSPCPRIPHESM